MKHFIFLLTILCLLTGCKKTYFEAEIVINNLRDYDIRAMVDGRPVAVSANDAVYADQHFDIEYADPVKIVEMYAMGASGEFDQLINALTIPVQPKGIYYMDTETDYALDLTHLSSTPPTSGSSGSGGDDSPEGIWMKTSGCSNLNGDRPIFRFDADGSGYFFTPDCANSCEDYGFYTYFNYTYTSSAIDIVHTSVSAYCGVEAPVPGDKTVNYSISGNTIELNGIPYEKQ